MAEQRIRRIGGREALEILRRPAVTVAPGAVEAAVAHIRLLAAHTRLVNAQIKEAHRTLDTVCERIAGGGGRGGGAPGRAPSDATVLRSLPGVGRVVLATLLSEAFEPLSRRDHGAMRNLCGVAPATRRSGMRRVVTMRRVAHVQLRLALFQWSRVAIQGDAVSRYRYADLRGRGHSL